MSGSFHDLGLDPALCAYAQQAGMAAPTPVQEATIPAILDGRDVLVRAPTGTGKTAAYALPLSQKLLKSRKPRFVLVLVPTRELVLQVEKVFRACLGESKKGQKQTPVTLVPLFGGSDRAEQEHFLAQATGRRILIATPGRLLDFVSNRICDLSECGYLVLDEGDRLFSPEFQEDTETLLSYLPSMRQTLVLSATQPESLKSTLLNLLHKPVEISIEQAPQKRGPIRQAALFLDPAQKPGFIKEFFSRAPKMRSIVFVRTKAEADQLAALLKKARLAAAPLHGDIAQDKRTSTVASFESGRLFILVATDVAARGLDVPSVKQVINYDVPDQPETYLHRIGRTGRGGEKGSALTLCTIDDRKSLRQIEVGAHVKLRIINAEQALPAPSQPQTASRRSKSVRP